MFIAFLLVVLLGVMLPAAFLQWHHQRELSSQVVADVTFLVNTAKSVLEHEVERSGLTQVRGRMESFCSGAGLYLFSVNASGDAWLEVGLGNATDGDGVRLRALARSPEVLASLQQSNTFLENGAVLLQAPFSMEPFDPTIPAKGKLVAGAIRLKGQYLWKNLLIAMAVATVAAAVLAVGFRMAMVRWLCTRLDETAAVARAIGSGDLKQRAPHHNSKELDELSSAVNCMADGIASQIKTISEQKTQLETVLNSMKEGVLVIDKQCCITTVNRAMVEIFPDAGNAMGRRPLEVILSPELQQACDETVGASLRVSRSFQIEPMRDRVYEVTMTRLRAEDRENGEECMGAVAVFHDISQLTRLERVRRDFVANVSHELRTPLTSIKGYAETLLLGLEAKGEGAGSPEQNFLEVILKHANQMTKTVNDLLHLARLESGERQFEFRMLNAVDAFTQAYKECMHLEEESGLVVRNLLPEDGVMVFADHNRLSQVFRNLLENALKYGIPTLMDSSAAGPGQVQGEVTVSCQVRDSDVVFSIRDQGPGIPKADRERIFERFYRVEKHRLKHKAGSSGLGLAIARHIVEKSGGSIWVESPVQDGHGAIFSFSLHKANPEDDV